MLSVGEEAAAPVTVPTRQNFTESTEHGPGTAATALCQFIHFTLSAQLLASSLQRDKEAERNGGARMQPDTGATL